MHTDLSRRITQLICTADSLSSVALKSELLDLARHCQVVPGNQFLVSVVCGSLERAASAVFGPLALLLVMTEPRRRQVYFAVLAQLEADGAFEATRLDERTRADLLSRFVLARNEDLIAQAYGSCPSGFLRLIGRFGDCAVNGVQPPPSYDFPVLRVRSRWMTGVEFLHGDYGGVSQVTGRGDLRGRAAALAG